MINNMSNFNASQREAICHGDGPALVLAGPGSGKTTVITKRLEYMIRVRQIPPEDIMVVTFTKAAAAQMRQRFVSLMEAELPVRFGTFHAIYYHILRESFQGQSLKVITEKEKITFMQRMLRDRQLSVKLAPAFLEAADRLKNGEASDEKALPEGISDRQAMDVLEGFRRLCRESGRLDFDDMAWECLQLFEQRPDLLKQWQGRCRYILADEYQDVAPIQEQVLFLLALPENNLFLVGDDDQSIYGFRGAGTESMLSFPGKYPHARQIILETNYRCRPQIIRAAGMVIAENRQRFVKTQTAARESLGGQEVICRGFTDRETENREIVKLLRDFGRAGKLANTAVLYRKHTDAASLVGLLDRHRLPYVRMGEEKSLSGHFITKDITAYLRFLYGQRTRKNFYRIMNRPERGISREGCSKEWVDFAELLRWHKTETDVMNQIRRLEADCLRARGMCLYAAVTYIRRGRGYEAWLQHTCRGTALEENMQILARLQKLAGEAVTMAGWEAYWESEEERGHRRVPDPDRDIGVRILTYHASKGLEFDYVIMPGLNEGSVPHKKAVSEKEMEEERRMFYVGMTRARERLFLFYRTGTKEEPETMSRFLRVLSSRD